MKLNTLFAVALTVLPATLLAEKIELKFLSQKESKSEHNIQHVPYSYACSLMAEVSQEPSVLFSMAKSYLMLGQSFESYGYFRASSVEQLKRMVTEASTTQPVVQQSSQTSSKEGYFAYLDGREIVLHQFKPGMVDSGDGFRNKSQAAKDLISILQVACGSVNSPLPQLID